MTLNSTLNKPAELSTSTPPDSQMLDLGENSHAVAQATGLSLAQIREAQRLTPAPADRTTTSFAPTP